MSLKITDLGPLYKAHIETLESTARGTSPWKDTAEAVLAFQAKDTSALLTNLHKAQRISRIATAGLENDHAFQDEVVRALWDNKDDTLPAPIEWQQNLAEKVFNLRTGTADSGLVRIGMDSPKIGAHLVQKCLDSKMPFFLDFIDPSFNALILNHASDEGIKALAEAYAAVNLQCNRSMIVAPGTPDTPPVKANKEKTKIYTEILAPISARATTGEMFYTLTVIPSRKDAEVDGIPYEDYVQLFFEMCDQPWDEVSKAQQALIAEFDTAKRVRITNSDGTDVSMELVDHDGKHFTFCNSLIAKNVPGSEIFSAPRLDSVEGVVVAKGKFEHGPVIMENLHLEFKKGVLVNHSAEKGQEELDRILSADEGTKRVGELGIGTNPHLKQHVSNGLLVEKIGGSFHLALGACYKYTEYGGVPVHVNNGSVSKLHWDVTTMLHGKEGRIYLDDRLVMDNGQWLDKKYDVLNRGWAALPEDRRPPYWREKLKQKPAA